MSYDHWKTTEPLDGTPWQVCTFCKRCDAESHMWLTDHSEWTCEDCAAEAEGDASEWEDDPCEPAS